MLRDISAQAVFMGFLTAFAGFASSFAVVLQGLTAVGASEAQAASGLMALAIAMGLGGIVLSAATRAPVSVAWSTPGAALLASTGAIDGGFAAVVGAFLVCGFGFVLAGLWKPLSRAIGAIPAPLANAMLAGILVSLCLAPFKAIAFDPLLGLPILLAWIIVGAFNKLLAVPAALTVYFLIVAFGVDVSAQGLNSVYASAVPRLEFISPAFSVAGILNIAIPLFIVTMASQNIPGIAVMTSNGFAAKPRLWFTVTGIFSVLAAPFGGHAVNLAALTAAMCAGEDAHRDPNRRYWAAIVAGMGYIAFGLLAGVVTAFVSIAPAILIQAVAGLALIAAFSGATVAAFKDPGTREAAAVTFLVSASGVSVGGISGAFWGLIAGGAIMLVKRTKLF
ncbi:MAG: benzoate/H(+) symporter BenE family transporter [Alphaproteobacteria bacterium]|nr:benzoate/H(+) symporter BenE family transporter [Alphaproteobacteria bacterium]